jgi:tetratricopeptide (TPR) repeat protein
MRKINGKAFLILLVCVATAAAGMTTLYFVQQRRIGEALRWQARRAEEQGDSPRAARMLQRYLEFNPRDTTERANLARLWAGDHPFHPRLRHRAVHEMDRVLLTDDDPALRRLLVKTALTVREASLARTHLKKLLPEEDMRTAAAAEREARSRGVELPEPLLRPNAGRGELESYWGLLMEVDQKPEDAMACYRLAIRHAPEHQASYARLASLLRRNPGTTEAERQASHAEAGRVLDSLVANNPSSHEAYLTRWRHRRDFGLINLREAGGRGPVTLDQAGEDVAQALRRKPDSFEVLLAAADLERLRSRDAVEDPARSEEQRRAGLKAHREKAYAHIERGLELVRSRKAPGDDHWELQLLWHKGNMLLDGLDLEPGQGDRAPDDLANRKAEIEAVTESVRKAGIAGAAEYMKARLAFHERRWAEAASLFERARASLSAQPDLASQADLYLGACFERLEEPTRMFNAYRRVADWDATSIPAHMGMAAARLLQGQVADALKQYEVLGRQGRIPTRALLDVVRLETQVQASSPTPDWRRAEALLEQAATHNSSATVEVAILRASLLARQGKADEAREALEKARAGQSNEDELWAALADLALAAGKPEQARKTLEEARAKIGDRVSLRLASARLPGPSVDQAAGREKFTEEEQARLLGGLADLALRRGKPSEARKLWAALVGLPRYANELRLHLLLFDAALREGDTGGMESALASIIAIEPSGGPYQHYGKALTAVWRAKKAEGEERQAALDVARRELDAVAAARPSWPPLFLARAEADELAGRPEEAINNLEDAVKHGESSPAVIGRLASLLSRAGRNAQAQVYLQRMNKAALRDEALGRLAVQVALSRGDVARALDLARAAIRNESRDPRGLVFLARALAANKQLDEAERKITEAIEADPADPEGWVARVQFLTEQKRRPEALKAIADAEKAIAPARRSLALALCHEVVAQPTEALRHYQAALAEARDNPAVIKAVADAHLRAGRSSQAEPLLRKLASTPAAGPDRDWARRGLAVTLASSTDYQRFTEALALVGLKLGPDGRLPPLDLRGQATEALRAQARVLASQAQHSMRARAIEVLEELDRRGPLPAEDRFLLAVLYEAQGDAARSQERLRELAQAPLRNPRYLAQYARGLVVKGRNAAALAEADKAVAMLEEMEKQSGVGPNGFASIDLRCRILEARGKPEESVALMKSHVRRAGASPREVVLLLDLLARQRKYAEAHTLCEETWQAGKCPPEALAAAQASLLHVSSPTDAQLATAEKRLKAAASAQPKNTILQLQLADLLDRRGQYPEAARIYRDVLAREPNNFLAMNNLAWMLAHGGGNAREALEQIEKALAGMGRRPDLLDTRGMVHLALKDTASALADLKEAAADGTSPQRLFHLARAHHEARDREAARAALGRARDAGLEVALLHPVEQEAARKLLAEYGL